MNAGDLEVVIQNERARVGAKIAAICEEPCTTQSTPIPASHRVTSIASVAVGAQLISDRVARFIDMTGRLAAISSVSDEFTASTRTGNRRAARRKRKAKLKRGK